MSTFISDTDGGSQSSSRNGLGKIWLKIPYQLTKPNSVDREWPGGLCDIATLGPCLPPTLSWASLTRNGQLLDLKLQVDRGVLIRFGSSGLETHGSLQTWELLGIYFSYIPREHLQRERKEGSYGRNCTWDAWAHCVLMTSWGFPRRECYLFLWIISVSSTTSLWSSSPFHKTERSVAELLLFRTWATRTSCVFSYLGDWVKRVRPLRRREAHVQDASGHLAGDGHPLYGLPHGLLRPHRYFKAAEWATVPEADVMFNVHWNRHQAGKERRQKAHIVNISGKWPLLTFLFCWQLFLPHLRLCLTE